MGVEFQQSVGWATRSTSLRAGPFAHAVNVTLPELSSIKTGHYQAQVIEKCTVYLNSPRVEFQEGSL